MGITKSDSLRAAFGKALASMLAEAKSFAWTSATALETRIKECGAVQTAKAQLEPLSPCFPGLPDVPRYFKALADHGKLTLSIEYLVTSRDWGDLFTPAEREIALRRLTDYNFVPPDPDEMSVVVATEHKLTRLNCDRGSFIPFFYRCDSECDEITWLHRELQENGKLIPGGRQREHLLRCRECSAKYGDVIAAFAALDDEWLSLFPALSRNLAESLNFSAERIQALAEASYPPSKSDFEEADQYEADFNVHRETVEGQLAWRALLLAEFTGKAMNLYAETLRERSHIWSEWRLSDEAALSALLRKLPPDSLSAALMAKWIYGSCRFRPDENTLALPADGDLIAVAGVLIIQVTSDSDDWSDMLGQPPKEVCPLNILGMAYEAARAETLPSTRQIKNQDDVGEIARSIKELTEKVESNSALQLPTIELLERMLRCVDTASRQKAEQAVAVQLGPVYGKLCHQARESVISAEQVFLKHDFASQDLIVVCLGRAFEIQLNSVFLPRFFEYLLRGNVRDYPDGTSGPKLLQNGRERKGLSLYEISQILSVDRPELLGFCNAHGISVSGLRAGLREVRRPRNIAAHDPALPSWRIRELHDKWLGVDTRDGGIFASVTL